MATTWFMVAINDGNRSFTDSGGAPSKWKPGTILQEVSGADSFEWGDKCMFLCIEATGVVIDDAFRQDVIHRKKMVDLDVALSAADKALYRVNSTKMAEFLTSAKQGSMGYGLAEKTYRGWFENNGKKPPSSAIDFDAAGVILTTPSWQHIEV